MSFENREYISDHTPGYQIFTNPLFRHGQNTYSFEIMKLRAKIHDLIFIQILMSLNSYIYILKLSLLFLEEYLAEYAFVKQKESSFLSVYCHGKLKSN